MKGAISGVIGIVVASSISVAAQWPKYQESGVPRDAQGKVRMDAPTPRAPDGKPDLSGNWVRADGAHEDIQEMLMKRLGVRSE